MKECLVLSDSKRKVKWGNPTKAIKVYDGQYIRVLRRHYPKIPTLLLSAKYGLIHAEQPIEYYEEMLPGRLSRKWVDKFIVERWVKLTGGRPEHFDIIWHLCAGSYRAAIEQLGRWALVQSVIEDEEDLATNVRWAIGVRSSYLKRFCMSRGGE